MFFVKIICYGIMKSMQECNTRKHTSHPVIPNHFCIWLSSDILLQILKCIMKRAMVWLKMLYLTEKTFILLKMKLYLGCLLVDNVWFFLHLSNE